VQMCVYACLCIFLIAVCLISQDSYRMKSNPRGLAVIINNHFFTEMSRRDGTNCDLLMLQNLFNDLKFTVEPFNSLAAEVSVFCQTICADLVAMWLVFALCVFLGDIACMQSIRFDLFLQMLHVAWSVCLCVCVCRG